MLLHLWTADPSESRLVARTVPVDATRTQRYIPSVYPVAAGTDDCIQTVRLVSHAGALAVRVYPARATLISGGVLTPATIHAFPAEIRRKANGLTSAVLPIVWRSFLAAR